MGRVRRGLGREIEVVDVNVDVHGPLAHRLGIEGIPTLVLLKDGKALSRLTGAKPEATIRKWILETGKSSAWSRLKSILEAM